VRQRQAYGLAAEGKKNVVEVFEKIIAGSFPKSLTNKLQIWKAQKTLSTINTKKNVCRHC
jgi:hypothetical protein